MQIDRHDEVNICFCNFANMQKNILILIISFYIQPDGGPVGTKHVAYRYITMNCL